MFSTFTTRGGKDLIIRSEDLRILADEADGAAITWLVGTEEHHAQVQGTAQANLDRLKAEELAALAEAQRQQARAQGLTPYPIARGREKKAIR